MDDTIKANADLQYKTGMTPQVVRTESGNCCEWCREVVGTYSYPKVLRTYGEDISGVDVRLTMTRRMEKFRVLGVKIWRKKEKTQESIERVEKFKESALVESIKNDIAKLDMTKVGPSDIIDIGKRINYHFKSFRTYRR
ncbi:phage protein [Streptococcus pyogenes]|nr:phage protein [Streptococcus pyogenes]